MSDGARNAAIALVLGLAAFGVAAVLLRAEPAPSPPPPEPETVEVLPPVPAEGAAITVKVLGPGGEPVECGATLWEAIEGGRRMSMDASQKCDAQGVMTWPAVQPGTYRLMAAGPGMARLEEEVVVAEEDLDLGTRTLALGGGVVGVVTDAEGQPVPTPTVFIGARQERGLETGQYVVKGLPVGEHTLRFGAIQGRAERTVMVTAGDDQVLDVVLEPLPGVVGVRFDGLMTVVEVHPTGPAAGHIRPGMVLQKVEGQPVDDLEQARGLMEGPVGAVLRLTLDGQDIALTRVSMQELM